MYKMRMEMESMPCFSRNINLNEGAAAAGATAGVDDEDEDVDEQEAKMMRGELGDVVKQSMLKEVAKGVDFDAFAERISRVYDELVGVIPVEVLRPECCSQVLAAADCQARLGQKREHNAMRHLEQHASIVGHMERKGLLDSETYLEMGAGKAGLSDTLVKSIGRQVRLCVVGGRGPTQRHHQYTDTQHSQQTHTIRLLHANKGSKPRNLTHSPATLLSRLMESNCCCIRASYGGGWCRLSEQAADTRATRTCGALREATTFGGSAWTLHTSISPPSTL